MTKDRYTIHGGKCKEVFLTNLVLEGVEQGLLIVPHIIHRNGQSCAVILAEDNPAVFGCARVQKLCDSDGNEDITIRRDTEDASETRISRATMLAGPE